MELETMSDNRTTKKMPSKTNDRNRIAGNSSRLPRWIRECLAELVGTYFLIVRMMK